MKTTMKASAVLAVAILAAVSCKKSEEQPSMPTDTFMCATESHVGDGKTSLDNVQVKWSRNDVIRIWNDVGGHQDFKLQTGDGTTSAQFSSTTSLGEGISYVSVYPNEGTWNNNNGKIVIEGVKLLQNQKYTLDGFSTGTNPMAAYATNKNLKFANLCGLLKVTLQGDYTVASIVITGNDDTALWGNGSVTVTPPAGDGDPSYNFSGLDGNNSVLLECDVDITTATDFYFVLPNGALSTGFTMEVDCGTAGVFTKDTGLSSFNKIVAGQIKTMPSTTVSPTPDTDMQGVLSGKFSINSDKKQVQFAKGNLQYNPKQGVWRFPRHQWDFCEHNNGTSTHYNNKDYDGWIDLFGWGTSNYEHGAEEWRPWNTTRDDSKYYAYGNDLSNLDDGNDDMKGKADWGYNKISNGGDEENQWRTLSGGKNGEWYYLLNERTTSYMDESGDSRRYSEVVVNGIHGVLLFPDNFSSWPSDGGEEPHSFNQYDNTDVVYYTPGQLHALELKGVVFLPCAGCRAGTNISNVGTTDGFYWTSTHSDKIYSGNGIRAYAYGLNFYQGAVDVTYSSYRYMGRSVRLVKDVDTSAK